MSLSDALLKKASSAIVFLKKYGSGGGY